MNNKDNVRRCFWLFFFSVVFIAGFIAGAIIQNSERINGIISDHASDVVLLRLENNAVSIFADTVVSYLILTVSVCLIGLSKSGVLLNVCLILCMGMGKGALISNLVCDSGSRGLGFSVFALLPGMITAVCSVLIFASGISSLSNTQQHFRQILKMLLICIFTVVFSAGLDVTFAKLYKVIT